jgi:hypothetical protein
MNEITLGQLAPTKTEIDQITETIRLELEEGRINPEFVAVKIAAIENFAKALRVKSEEYIIDFLSKCPKGTYDYLGAKISLKDSQTYDYGAYSEKWAELEDKIQGLKAEQKAIEESAKKFERGQIPLKSYKQTYSLTLTK